MNAKVSLQELLTTILRVLQTNADATSYLKDELLPPAN